jgi:hypothetical protein
MGANTFTNYQAGTRLDEAFRDAVTAAAYENGHGGYTGSLAEKSGVTVIDRTVRWLTDAEMTADRLIEAEDDRIRDKWGPAGALAVCRPTYETSVTVVVPVRTTPDWVAEATKALKTGKDTVVAARPVVTTTTGHQQTVQLLVTVRRAAAGTISTRQVRLKFAGELRPEHRQNLVDGELRDRLRKGEALVGFHIVDEERVTRAEKTPARGRMVRYVVRGDRAHDCFETGFASLTEAKARAAELAGEPPARHQSPRVLHVEGITRAADGTALYTARQVVRTTTLTVEMRVVAGRGEPPTQDGWLFFGWASS